LDVANGTDELLLEELGAVEFLDAGAASIGPELYPGLTCDPSGEYGVASLWDMELE
jgi:hypothetical protein